MSLSLYTSWGSNNSGCLGQHHYEDVNLQTNTNIFELKFNQANNTDHSPNIDKSDSLNTNTDINTNFPNINISTTNIADINTANIDQAPNYPQYYMNIRNLSISMTIPLKIKKIACGGCHTLAIDG
jgi:alpha-tubulin suppressor-like RCC1 family protein